MWRLRVVQSFQPGVGSRPIPCVGEPGDPFLPNGVRGVRAELLCELRCVFPQPLEELVAPLKILTPCLKLFQFGVLLAITLNVAFLNGVPKLPCDGVGVGLSGMVSQIAFERIEKGFRIDEVVSKESPG